MPQPTRNHKVLTIAHVALGGNATSSFGAPEKTLMAAKQAISCDSVNLLAESRLFRSAAVPKGSGPDFVNAAVRLETSLDCGELLAHLHRIEAQFERVRKTRWGARTLDLDLLDFGRAVVPDPQTVQSWMDLPIEWQMRETPDQLLLPHPRLQDRAFVLIPLADIAPDWTHPLTAQPLAAMLGGLPEAEKRGLVPLEAEF